MGPRYDNSLQLFVHNNASETNRVHIHSTSPEKGGPRGNATYPVRPGELTGISGYYSHQAGMPYTISASMGTQSVTVNGTVTGRQIVYIEITSTGRLTTVGNLTVCSPRLASYYTHTATSVPRSSSRTS